jgi:hypothetical protein
MQYPTDARNLQHIERLNQRGGETLSVAHLIAAGTVDLDLSAYLLASIAGGASMLTAARPGGAGKSTLLANLLAFLPPGDPIETVSGGRDVPEAFATPLLANASEASHRRCWLAHEIGSGHYYGYIWGHDAAQFLSIPRKTGARIASCLHADTLEDLREVLLSEQIGAAEQDVRHIGLLLFMNVDRGGPQWRHRVATVWEAQEDGHRLIWEWQRRDDRFVQVGESCVAAARLDWSKQTLKAFLASGEPSFARMLAHVTRGYSLADSSP